MAYTYGTEEWDKAYQALVAERLSTVGKPYVMGTPEWVASYEKLIQEDAAYKEAAKTWEGSGSISGQAGLVKKMLRSWTWARRLPPGLLVRV